MSRRNLEGVELFTSLLRHFRVVQEPRVAGRRAGPAIGESAGRPNNEWFGFAVAGVFISILCDSASGAGVE